ncbi:MAG: molybdopterin-guanine dinucleotide biosynthesis protein B [Chloroflexota bacterium]
MPPLLSVVGRSGVGKTTLLERLIPELKARGHRVAAVKHAHEGFTLDVEGKDSWRLVQAGSQTVLLFSQKEMALFSCHEVEPALAQLSRYITEEVDIILVEGLSRERGAKIEVHRPETGDLLYPAEDLWAVVSDAPLKLPVSRFSWQEIAKLADAVERNFLNSKGQVELFINGFPLPLSPFVQEMIANTVRGLVSGLKGVDEVGSLELRLRP